jgi:hypothetical protein
MVWPLSSRSNVKVNCSADGQPASISKGVRPKESCAQVDGAGEKGRGTVNGRYHEDEDHKGKCSMDDGRQSSPEAFRGTPRFTP